MSSYLKKITTGLLIGVFVVGSGFAMLSRANATTGENENENSNGNQNSNSNTNVSTPAEIAACMKTAIQTRDGSIGTAFTAFSTSVTEALTTRTASQVAAWDIGNRNERKAALKAAWEKFHGARKLARRTFNAARKSAWNKYKTDRKACHGTSDGDGDGEGRDQLI